MFPADTRRLLCQVTNPSQACSAFDDEAACQSACHMSYQIYVAEDVCAPVSGTQGDNPVASDTTATEILSVLSPDAEAWASGAYGPSFSCLNLDVNDGSCHGWVVTYRAADMEDNLQVTAVTGLTPTSKTTSLAALDPLAEGWLDSDDVAPTILANEP